MITPDRNFWKYKKVLVTGGEGFKGKWLVEWLRELGAIVIAPTEDICNYMFYRDLVIWNNIDIVFHLAAVSTVHEAFLNPVKAISTNAVGTTVLLDVLKSVGYIKAIINVTTDKVYQIKDIERGYTEQEALGGQEIYSVSKVCSELISKVYAKTFGMPIATARAGNVIGGGDFTESRIIPNYIKAKSSKATLKITEGAIRPWQYVLDALCGYLLLAERLYNNTAYMGGWNFASNEFESQTVQWLVDEMNKYFEYGVSYTLVPSQGFLETQVLKMNSEKAKKALGWFPKYTMEEMVKRTAWWYNRYAKGDNPADLYSKEISEYMGGQ